MKELAQIFDTSFWIFAFATAVIVTGVWVVGDYTTKRDALMAQNIETAISKGLDPLSVRCSYADRNDNVCVAYAASKK